MTSPVLVVDTVFKTFGGIRALDGLSLNVDRGEILGVIGPNGAGKTALVNTITGFYQATSGSIRFHGRELVGLSLHEIGRLGLARTFQNIRLFKRMTVLENVLVADDAFARKPLRSFFQFAARRERTARAMALLEMMGLAGKANRNAGGLAYGEARRLEIARALSGSPSLLLLDEPAAGMNEQETEELIADIGRCLAQVEAILLVEHDMHLIRSLSHRIVAMDYGRKIAEGKPQAVLQDQAVQEAYLGSSEE